MITRLAVFFAALPLVSPSAVFAADPRIGSDSRTQEERRFVEGLRERRMFSLAESRCETELARSDLPDDLRAAIAAELAETCAAHARELAPDAREPLWRRALAACDALGERPAASQGALLKVQKALVLLARGELARQEAELTGAADRLKEARDSLFNAVDELEIARKAVNQLVGELKNADPSPGELDGRELATLADHIDFHLARAYRNQAQSYPADGPDRINSLELAGKELDRVLNRTLVDRLTWPARIDAIVCLRLGGDFPKATARLEAAMKEKPLPPEFAAALNAERLRLLLEEDRVSDAIQLATGNEPNERPNADFDYARIETFLAATRAAQDDDEARRWQDRALVAVREIESRHGGYWRRRAEMLLAHSLEGESAVDNPELLLNAADGLYRAEQFDQALVAYDRAYQAARAANDVEFAFRAANTAAHVEQKRGRHAEARRRFCELAESLSDHPQASEAHLLAIFNEAQAAKTRSASESPSTNDATKADEECIAMLREHLDRWPNAPSASQARIWLGRLSEIKRRWSDAVDAYGGVPVEHEKHAEALAGLERSYRAWLVETRGTGQAVTTIARHAAESFEAIVLSERGNLPERWTATQRQSALAAAEIWLVNFPDQFARAERILLAARASIETADASDPGIQAWRSAASGLLALALAGQGKNEEASAALAEVEGESPAALLALIEGLDKLSASTGATRGPLAELQLLAADRLAKDRDALSADEQRRLDLARLRALAAVGRRDEALAAARAMAKESPREGAVQEALALLLSEGSTRSELDEALQQWKLVGDKSRPGGERWLRAAYYQALLLDKSGKREEAVRRIKFVQNQFPELGGGDLREKFLTLLRAPSR